jgi:hypothetical protein
MSALQQNILAKNFSINEKYKVLLFIKQGSNAETYRVKGNNGKLYFLKLFNYSKLHRSAFDADNNLLEIEIVKALKNNNILTYVDSGELFIENKRYGYLVLDSENTNYSFGSLQRVLKKGLKYIGFERIKSFKNILGYFAKGEKLTKVSTDILYKINDEYVNDNEISKVLDNLITNNPQLADYIKMPNDIPYFLNYIQLIKKYNPKIWPRFLTMLYKTKDEIEDIINKKGT